MPTRTRGDVLLLTRDPALQTLLASCLEAEGWNAVPAATIDAAAGAARSASAALLVIDSRNVPALETAARLRRINPALGVVHVIGQEDADLAVEAARQGAYDFLIRPLDPSGARFRLRVALEKHSRAVEERAYTVALEERINSRTEQVVQTRERIRAQFINTIRALERALQAKNVYTEGHSRRVAEKAVEVARAMGVPREQLRFIELGALFHDIGKIGIRDDVLNKAAPLTPEEHEHMKTHPLVAEQILAPIEELRPIVDIVKYEHERWDGQGYPSGLRGDQIPLGARLIAIADAWDSMVFDRVYRKAMPHEAALAEIERHAGTQFDPACVEVFVRLERQRLAATTGRYAVPGASGTP
ncbi:MAG TPA: HD domain-containing phosphohydrolase [Planctomycetota bacterium]|nr:HD domain-containing phosphohydrolase [Planctomycetota bacterium]